MRPIHLAATLVLAAAAASAAEDQGPALRGKWRLDKPATAEAMPEYAKGSPAQQKELKERFAAMREAIFEFTEKELYYGDVGSVPDISTYRVLGTKDRRIELELTSENYDGQVKVEKATAELVGSDQMRLSGRDAPTMVFRRVK